MAVCDAQGHLSRLTVAPERVVHVSECRRARDTLRAICSLCQARADMHMISIWSGTACTPQMLCGSCQPQCTRRLSISICLKFVTRRRLAPHVHMLAAASAVVRVRAPRTIAWYAVAPATQPFLMVAYRTRALPLLWWSCAALRRFPVDAPARAPVCTRRSGCNCNEQPGRAIAARSTHLSAYT